MTVSTGRRGILVPLFLSLSRFSLFSLSSVFALCACGGTVVSTGPGSGNGTGNGTSGSPGESGPGTSSASACTGASCTTVPECPDVSVPTKLTATVSGFSECTCLNGVFTLTQTSDGEWSSAAIVGCPGQTDPAYVKFTTSVSAPGLGITDMTSDPGSGNSDFAPVTTLSCAPFSVTGGGSQAGNINAFCPGSEDEQMRWTVE